MEDDDPMLDEIALLKDLVGINSVNPDLVEGAAGEAAIAAFCAAWLIDQGFEVSRLEERPGRPSIVGRLKGRGGGKSLMFNGHLDTVTLHPYEGDPLIPQIVGDRLYGRGAFDMKSGVAAMMVAAARTRQQSLRGDVLVACVADEEYASTGTTEVIRQFSADAAIVTEPSYLELTLAHKGFVWFEIIVTGRAAHGSRPELGIDAISKAGYFLVALDALGTSLQQTSRHTILQNGSIHASLIDGGQELSSYPAQCQIFVERRTVPGESADGMEAELRDLLDKLTRSVPHFSFTLKRGLVRHPFEANRDAAIVSTLSRCAEKVLGQKPAIRGEPFWTDCALLQAANIPCLMFGADGGGAHATCEWTTLSSMRHLTEILWATACAFCA
jgi:acetylornithine deacetylase